MISIRSATSSCDFTYQHHTPHRPSEIVLRFIDLMTRRIISKTTRLFKYRCSWFIAGGSACARRTADRGPLRRCKPSRPTSHQPQSIAKLVDDGRQNPLIGVRVIFAVQRCEKNSDPDQ